MSDDAPTLDVHNVDLTGPAGSAEPDGRETLAGFVAFERVEHTDQRIRAADGSVGYVRRYMDHGVGYTAHLPDGGRVTLTPGDRYDHVAEGWYLAAYDPLENWVWGQQFPDARTALSAARAQLRDTEPVGGGPGAPDAPAEIAELAEPGRGRLQDQDEEWLVQAAQITGTPDSNHGAPTGPRRPEVERRGGDQRATRAGPPR